MLTTGTYKPKELLFEQEQHILGENLASVKTLFSTETHNDDPQNYS